MNEILDQYLAAVGAGLPRGTQADIIAELRDLLLTKIEATEEALGRPLNGEEGLALLAEFGHPLEVAGRYARNQHLIGPGLYPFYLFGLKAVLGIVAAIGVTGLLFNLVMFGPAAGFPVWNLAPSLMIAFAAVTLTAALIERFGRGARYLRAWRPGQFPSPAPRRGRKACNVLVEAALNAVILVCWVGLDRVGIVRGLPVSNTTHSIEFAFAPIWGQLYWPIAILLAVQTGLSFYEFLLPGPYRLHAALRIGARLCMAPLMLILAQAGHWFDVSIPSHAAAAAGLEAQIDRWLPIGVAIALLIILIETACDAWRLLRPDRPSA